MATYRNPLALDSYPFGAVLRHDSFSLNGSEGRFETEGDGDQNGQIWTHPAFRVHDH